MKNLLIMQENEFSGTISIYLSTMQPLCRPTHVDKLVTSNFQICFPAPYLSLHAKYSHCRTCANTIQYNTNFIYIVGNTKQYNISYE